MTVPKKLAKKQLCTCSTLFCTFLCRCFARLQRETSRKFLVTRFMEEMSYVFFHFFSPPLIFTLHWWPLAFLISSPPLKNYYVVLQTKKCLLCCLSLAVYRSLSPFSLLSFAGLPPTFSFSLSFSCSISKFVDMTINLSLILQTTRIQKQFPLFVFVFIVSALQDSGGYAISRQNNLALHLGCHGIPVVRTDGRRR